MLRLLVRVMMLFWLCGFSLLSASIALGQQKDSQVIAYSAWVNERRIYVMDVELNLQHPLTAVDEGTERFPLWSPDGTRLAFQRAESQYALPTLVVADFPTGKSVNFPYSMISVPVWSPDGRWVAFSGYLDSGKNSILVVEPDTGMMKVVAEVDTIEVSWSPDGNWLLFMNQEQVFSIKMDCLNTPDDCQPYLNIPVDVMMASPKPGWSPDRKYVAVTGRGQSGVYLQIRAIYCGDLNDPTCLGDPVTFPTDYRRVFWLSWSPDGRSIALVGERSFDDIWLYINDVDTQEIRTFDVMLYSQELSWSPDSQQIVFTRQGEMMPLRSNIAILDVQSGNIHDLTQPINYDLDPVWRP
ncbi:MAG: hypothetical protein K8L97_32185 [Anaerolineae bacterium]|nr:hypothetical protein [Anaerolineae bacterium]